MRYTLQFKGYQRRFTRPVRLGQYLSEFREGIVLKMSDDAGRVGFGEIAPLESFGSESVEKAALLLKSYHGVFQDSHFNDIDAGEYPCTKYALETALRKVGSDGLVSQSAGASRPELILSAGLLQDAEIEEFIRSRGVRWQQQVLKLKIGGESVDMGEAISRICKAAEVCRDCGKKLRLDANEQLNRDDALRWLEGLEPVADVIEFFEQPLDRWYYAELLELARKSPIPIALDESIQMLNDQKEDPEGLEVFYLILKPSLGDMRLAKRFSIADERMVFSSVFETAIGFSDLLELAPFAETPGLDTQKLFADGLSYPGSDAGFYPGEIEAERIWAQLD